MAQPTPYIKSRTFTDASGVTYPVPASFLDQEFGLVQIAIASTDQDLKLIQRDDGALANGIVTPDSLSAAAVVLLGGWNPRGPWVAGTVYSVKDLVARPDGNYIAVAKHVSNDFPTDLASGDWQFLSSTSVASTTTVNNFSALRAISSAPSAVLVVGRTVAGDGGGGVFALDLTDTTSADNGGTIVVDALNRRWKRQFSGAVYAEWFGVLGNNTDCTAALQNAVNAVQAIIPTTQGAALQLPRGTIITSSPITISASSFALLGYGPTATFWVNSAANSDTLVISPGTGTYIGSTVVSGIRFYSTAVDPGTSGAHIHVVQSDSGFFNNLMVEGKFNELLVEGGLMNYAANINLTAGYYWTSRKPGSALARFTKYGTQAPAGWFLTNFNANSGGANTYVDDAVLIEAADGIQVSNFHIGFVGKAALHIRPAAGSVSTTGIVFDNGYFDGFFAGGGGAREDGVLIENPNANTGTFGLFEFSAAKSIGTYTTASFRVTSDATALNGVTWSGGMMGQATTGNQIALISAGKNFTINGLRLANGPAGKPGILINGTTTGVNINGPTCYNDSGYTMTPCVSIAGSADYVTVSGGNYNGITPVALTSSGTHNSVQASDAVWNNAAVDFFGSKFNITNTASGANSSALQIQVNGSDVFRIYASGFVIANGSLATATNFQVPNRWALSGGVGDGTALLTNYGNTAGVGFDVGTDGTLKLRNRAFGADAALTASAGTFSASLGYGTGAGGTVTQATSKSTGVTLNKASGQVTMNAAALAAAAKVSFVVTNSAIAATDGAIVWIASGGTANAYRAEVTAVAAGSFTVTVENITAGSLSEAPVLGFALIKAVTT